MRLILTVRVSDIIVVKDDLLSPRSRVFTGQRGDQSKVRNIAQSLTSRQETLEPLQIHMYSKITSAPFCKAVITTSVDTLGF